MAHYLITYDNHPPRNYTALYLLMKQWGAVRLAQSVWLANLKGPAGAVRKIVQTKLQLNDTVAVLELKSGSEWATSNVDRGASGWLSANICQAEVSA